MKRFNYKTVAWNDTIATRKCACGCGGTVEIKRRDVSPARVERNGGKIKGFIAGHIFKAEWFKPIHYKRNKDNIKLFPGIQPSTGRRFRGSRPYPRILMEEKIGRKLGRKEFVHHINGDKTDDRIENFEIMDIREHTSLHNQSIYDKLDMVKIMKMREDGFSQQKISKIFGVCQATIGKAIKYYKIQREI